MNTICELCNTPQSTVVHSITNDATSSSSLTSQKANNNKNEEEFHQRKVVPMIGIVQCAH